MEPVLSTRGDLIRWMLRHTAGPLVLGTLCIIAVVGVEVSLPRVLGEYLIDQVLIERHFGWLTWIALGGIALFFIKGLFTYGQVYLLTFVGQRLVYTLRRVLYRRILNMSVRQHSQFAHGTLIARMTSDVGVVQNAVTAGLGDLIQHGFTLVGILLMLFILNWQLSLIAFLALPLSAWAIRAYGARIRTYTARLQERIAGLTWTLQQSIEGIRLVKAFRMEDTLEERFENDNSQSFAASMKSAQAMATITPVVELLLVVSMFMVVWGGARFVLSGALTAGQLISFLAYLAMATRPIGFLTKSLNLLHQAVSALDRILEILQLPQDCDCVDSDQSVELAPDKPRGAIEFDRVSFEYEPGVEVLQDVSFRIEPGETVGIVGPSGAGKTSLVNLLMRFYEPSSGTIRIDGNDVAHIDPAGLRRSIGFVPQETLLFNMSVAENVAAGRPWIDRAAVETAVQLANAHEFVVQLPQGYDTIIGPGGVDLSGGQRQRIAIARAIAGEPSILILDEATSALDGHSERLVRDALDKVSGRCTTIIIAHRLSSLVHADRIFVFDGGRLVQVGTHDELTGEDGTYRRLFGGAMLADTNGGQGEQA